MPSTSKPDVLIIGGGVIGCALAWELARAGLKVTVVERGMCGGGASSAAAGILAPDFGSAPDGPLADLGHHSVTLYDDWIASLEAEVGYRRAGLLHLWKSKAEETAARKRVQAYVRPGRRAEIVTSRDLAELEPAMAPSVRGGLYFPDDAQVNAAQLAQAVARKAVAAGAVVREHEPVVRLMTSTVAVTAAENGITSVETVRARYCPKVVVIAAGAWSGQFGVAIPMRPVKGQLLEVECHTSPVNRPMHCGDALFVPRPDGTLVLGVTVEEAGFDESVTVEGLRAIVTETAALVPAVGGLTFRRAWAGLRPATPDELPVLGPLPPWRNLWVASGHFRKGVLLAPVTARLLSRSIQAGTLDPELAPFRPERFARNR
jgi:glycine oxidase